jgi:hypothetical protein
MLFFASDNGMPKAPAQNRMRPVVMRLAATWPGPMMVPARVSVA